MSTTKLIGSILIIISLAVGYLGFNKINDNSKEVNLLGLKVAVANESGKQEGYLYLGLAVVVFVGGVYSVTKKSV
ncbi:hypothetical protein ACSVH2_07440 [Flavobacterium sp. RSB2_4_14]|uniref:hypothetical protein n=1 Tax=Flavobacterium sp. RSB2_4_14 TaxID=3447665 RepID=UPI003F3588A8